MTIQTSNLFLVSAPMSNLCQLSNGSTPNISSVYAKYVNQGWHRGSSQYWISAPAAKCSAFVFAMCIWCNPMACILGTFWSILCLITTNSFFNVLGGCGIVYIRSPWPTLMIRDSLAQNIVKPLPRSVSTFSGPELWVLLTYHAFQYPFNILDSCAFPFRKPCSSSAS